MLNIPPPRVSEGCWLLHRQRFEYGDVKRDCGVYGSIGGLFGAFKMNIKAGMI